MKLRTGCALGVALASSFAGVAAAPAVATPVTASQHQASTPQTSDTDLGSYKGQTVTLVMTADGNSLQITKGKKTRTVAAPDGSLRQSLMKDGVVHLWFMQGSDLVHWTYSVKTGAQQSTTFADADVFSYLGGAGFWVALTGADGTVTDYAYNWLGQKLYTLPDSLRANASWFTRTAAYVRVEGANPTGVAVVPVDGSAIRTWELGLPVTGIGFSDNTSPVTVRYTDASGAPSTCTLSELGSTCPGAWA